MEGYEEHCKADVETLFRDTRTFARQQRGAPSIRFSAVPDISMLEVLSAVAQLPSPDWRKPNISTSPADRISIASAAIDKARSSLGTDGQFDGEDYIIAGNFYYQMAEFDIATNGTQYLDALTQYFPLAQENRGNFTDTLVSLSLHYGLPYGYAAARAYTAYRNPVFLQYAIESWWFGRMYTLSQPNIAAGRIAVKNFSISPLCQDNTSPCEGLAVFNKLNNLRSLSPSLSALLAEATADPIYLRAAEESTEFIRTHLTDSQSIILDSISGRANDSCAVSSILEPYNSGLMIEGLSTLASITKNASTQALLGTILGAAITDSAWQGSNGIIANVGHGSGGDIYLVRGLAVAYLRNQSTQSMHAYIEHYLAAQFNAILDLSTSGDSDIYGSPWIGPPSSSFSGGAQTLALSGLIAGISLRNDTDSAGVSTVSRARRLQARPSSLRRPLLLVLVLGIARQSGELWAAL
ncbi:hypothetical protein C8R44DRAFT_880736 [Mycena epipterygia]|nr:hypothetical protein C8R44DRAFT_880736 [Mycena epipterygia]